MMSEPPRYRPARSLPQNAFLPGRNARASAEPSTEPNAAISADVPAANWRDDEQYLWGVDLYNNGFFWEAHEAWERPWRAAARHGSQRSFLQGLIQCAAACVKNALGEEASVQRLARRALARLEQVRPDRNRSYMGLDLERFVTEFRRFARSHPRPTELRPLIWLATRELDNGA